ncbi:hypothetical protein GWN42_16535, partial [candidate division KSB1 bacterium]|nr:HAMP domain-containing histidine kinase [Phycisphaerae bacterium]NIU09865.1 HAMP domain-containing histidine kinase [Phycisphaerae bacterium]NIV94346.1 hypothetical protein [candidate division KSB1 bacterium]
YIELIEQDTDRLRRHVEDILDLSRIDASAIELDRSLVNLARVCDEVVSALHLISEEKNIPISTDLDPRHGFAYVDRHKIERSLTNVVQNALKF